MRPWLSDWLSVSTSFVMRESTSPFDMVPPSKYKSGTRAIFRAICPHMRYTTFCVTPVMIQLCTPDAAALARHMHNRPISMRLILPKSMPPVPAAAACAPRMTSVVAPPRTFGPTTEKSTLAIASATAAMSPTR